MSVDRDREQLRRDLERYKKLCTVLQYEKELETRRAEEYSKMLVKDIDAAELQVQHPTRVARSSYELQRLQPPSPLRPSPPREGPAATVSAADRHQRWQISSSPLTSSITTEDLRQQLEEIRASQGNAHIDVKPVRNAAESSKTATRVPPDGPDGPNSNSLYTSVKTALLDKLLYEEISSDTYEASVLALEEERNRPIEPNADEIQLLHVKIGPPRSPKKRTRSRETDMRSPEKKLMKRKRQEVSVSDNKGKGRERGSTPISISE
ncbi:hypothetical protein BC834DRAFT_965615 [Gloeopeniophorella convolvens]|nr:hypothetical protein BC834DRAFT_965615 [Gloeopeniophorella convolvens]